MPPVKLLVQEFLKTKSLVELFNEHKVNAHVEGHKMSLNYHQYDAKHSDVLAQQCRGLILRTTDGSPIPEDKPFHTAILAFPFFRFFNLGADSAASVDFHNPNTVVQEKHDGSLAILYFDDVMGEWCVATRAAPNGNISLNGYNSTARSLFEKAVFFHTKMTFSDWTVRLDKSLTYMFELCTPMNHVVVRHTTYNLTLLGVRDRITSYEASPQNYATQLGIPVVGQFHFSNVDEMIEFAMGRDPTAYEGLIVCQPVDNGVFNRVKVKHPKYTELSRMRDTISSPRNVMAMILDSILGPQFPAPRETLEDAWVVMPEEIQAHATRLKKGLSKVLTRFDEHYLELVQRVDAETSEPKGSREHRKVFARRAQEEVIWFEAAMAHYSEKCSSIQEFILQKKLEHESKTWTPSFLDNFILECEDAQPS